MSKLEFTPFFATPVMQVQLDLDLEKLTEFSSQIQNKDKKGMHCWQSNNIVEENHEEFIRLKKEINQYLQIYHSEVFRGMVFKENIVQGVDNMWINITKNMDPKAFNEWHVHPSCISGVYYIKHDGSNKQGDILFKNPSGLYMPLIHWPNIVEKTNMISADIVNIRPKSNMLLIFPAWLQHKVEVNLYDNSRISLAFNSNLNPKKKT